MEAAELVPAPVTLGGDIYATYLNGEEPMIRDLDLAGYLGYEARHEIRRLIERHASSLGEVFVTVTKTSSPTGGRPGRVSYLNERQALFICAKSETPQANEVLGAMIEVFIRVRRGQLGPSQAEVAEVRAEVAEVRAEVRAEVAQLREQIADLPRARPRPPKVERPVLPNPIDPWREVLYRWILAQRDRHESERHRHQQQPVLGCLYCRRAFIDHALAEVNDRTDSEASRKRVRRVMATLGWKLYPVRISGVPMPVFQVIRV